MPTSMPHAGVEQNHRVVQQLDMRVMAIPKWSWWVGKRARPPWTQRPSACTRTSTTVPRYEVDDKGHRITFRTDRQGRFIPPTATPFTGRTPSWPGSTGTCWCLTGGPLFRNWRPHIRRTDDIRAEVVAPLRFPGSLPPAAADRDPAGDAADRHARTMGIKVFGPTCPPSSGSAGAGEGGPSVKAGPCSPTGCVGKSPTCRCGGTARPSRGMGSPSRTAAHPGDRHRWHGHHHHREGLRLSRARVRYPRELRDDPDQLRRVLVPTPTGVQVPSANWRTWSMSVVPDDPQRGHFPCRLRALR